MAQDKPLTAWSHSALGLYDTCPRKYYEAKITKAWVEEFKGHAADWGLAVHKAFERRITYGTPFASNMSQWEPLAQRLNAAARKGMTRCEQQLAININHEPVDWFAKDVWCRTIIDLSIINVLNRKAMIWDYKTGKRKDDDTQLALMAGVVFDYYPEVDTVIAGYIWLKDGVQVDKLTFTRASKANLWAQFLPRVERLEQSITSGQWPEKQSGLCHGWCPVQDCQFWQPKKER